VSGHPYEQGFDLRLVPERLTDPLRWNTPRLIFVNSMSDLFHADVPDNYIVAVARVMQLASWHTYQVLTKRSERMRDMLQSQLKSAADQPHIWWGVSVEDRKYGIPRVQHLRAARAAVRFLSIEPLLEELGTLQLDGINWVIVGGESGPGARQMRAVWVRKIQQQCQRSKVPFFFKQWGGVRKHLAGRMLDGKTWDEFPKQRVTPVPTLDQRIALARETEAMFR
jgi:protein gp37